MAVIQKIKTSNCHWKNSFVNVAPIKNPNLSLSFKEWNIINLFEKHGHLPIPRTTSRRITDFLPLFLTEKMVPHLDVLYESLRTLHAEIDNILKDNYDIEKLKKTRKAAFNSANEIFKIIKIVLENLNLKKIMINNISMEDRRAGIKRSSDLIDRRISEIVSNSIFTICHDVKNMLHNIESIFGVLELNGIKKISKKEIKIVYGISKEAVSHALELMDDMKGIIEAVKNCAELKKKSFNIGLEILKEINLHKIHFDGEIQFTGYPNKKINTNRPIFRIIIRNLIQNAVKFTPSGNIFVNIFSDNDRVTIEVRDTGIGIAKEDMIHLFTIAGSEISAGELSKNKGNGIGLSLVKAWVIELGGSISAKSEIGKGASFFVKLPRN